MEIVHGRWKATTDHVSTGIIDEEERLTGSRRFDDDHWALFDLDSDFSEATDVAARHADVVETMRRLWLTEAERKAVLAASPVKGKYDEAIDRESAFEVLQKGLPPQEGSADEQKEAGEASQAGGGGFWPQTNTPRLRRSRGGWA